MDAEIAAGELLAQSWRTHCQQHADRFLPVGGTAARRTRIEKCEAELINQLGQAEVSLAVKAVAFRSIVELRGCTARDVGTFFNVDTPIIAAALSLLILPTVRTKHVSRPPAAARKSRSRNSAA